jgi:hypothetical protein
MSSRLASFSSSYPGLTNLPLTVTLMSTVTDLSKLPPGAKVFSVHVQFRVTGKSTIYQLLLNHLNGGIHGGLFSMRVRHDDQVFDLPLGQYIVAGNWGIDKVFDRVEKAALEASRERAHGAMEPPYQVVVLAIDPKEGIRVHPPR